MGYQRQFEDALESDGFEDALRTTRDFYAYMDFWLQEIVKYGSELDSEVVMALFNQALEARIDRLVSAAA